MFSLESLNPLQKEIAMDTDGAILVTAGAGSGKTRLLTHRICYLIEEKGIDPSNILAITFTNKATNEMRERISKMVENCDGITIKTMHSLCAAILRANIDALDGFDRRFSVYDSSDSDKLLKKVLKDLNIPESIAKYAQYHISKAKNEGLMPSEYLQVNNHIQHIDDYVRIYAEYQRQLKENNALDFDDLLLQTLQLFKTNSDILEFFQEKFKYIHVDEFQDTNVVQYKIIKLISLKYKNVFVVGDEDQCIYSWRGANISNISEFITDYNCKIYKLEQNYRSTKSIIKSANKLIKNNSERIDKTLFTENEEGDDITFYEGYNEQEEAEYVAREIYSLQSSGVPLDSIGVLMRVSALSRLMEEKLLNYNLPYKTSGIFKFFERLEIKNILSYLTMIVNPRDNSSVLRIINYPKRGIGQTTIDKLVIEAEKSHTPLTELIENIRMEDFSSSIKAKIIEFADMIADFKEKYTQLGLTEFVEYVINTTGIKGLYNTDSEEDIDRTMNIDQFIQSVDSFEKSNENANLIDYLESVTLQNDLEKADDNLTSVSISTIHASKGLEFDYVFIIGLEEGKFPLSRAMDSANELEEERRLMYVAVTRARKKLYLTMAKSRFMYGSRERQMTSRFISEMGIIERKPYTPKYDYEEYSEYGFDNGYGRGKGYGHAYDAFRARTTTQKSTSNSSGGLSNLQGLMSSKLDSQKKNLSDYKVGVQVLHTKFGVGKIIKVDGGDNAYVSIDFGKIGVKTLSLNFAPLQILK